MCRIVVEKDDDGKYLFLVRKKASNYLIATSQKFASRDDCINGLSQFLVLCFDKSLWKLELEDGSFFYAYWKYRETTVSTRRYGKPQSRNLNVKHMMQNISAKTKITFTVIEKS